MTALINPRAHVSLQHPPFLSRRAFAFAAIAQLLLLGAHADVTFSGPNASPSLTGSSQTFSGETIFSQTLSFRYEDDSTSEVGYWDGESLSGTYSYFGDGDFSRGFLLNTEGLFGSKDDLYRANVDLIYRVSADGYLVGSLPNGLDSSSAGLYGSGSSAGTWYSIAAYDPFSFSLSARSDSGSSGADWIFRTQLNTSTTLPGVSFYVDASTGVASGTIAVSPPFYTWYKSTSLPSTSKTRRINRLSTLQTRSIPAMSLGGSSNVLALYGTASTTVPTIELNPTAGTIKLKNVTIQPSGTASRTFTLPDNTGTILTTSSSLDVNKLSSVVPTTKLPTTVTYLGATVELNSSEVSGNLPWSRLSSTPTTIAGYGIYDAAIPGAATVQGPTTLKGAVTMTAPVTVSNVLRIAPAGDLDMGDFKTGTAVVYIP
ncbi:MAG: hypothetical protein H2172_10410 [Opitutus sp.]|nr:hypothetical protein [Opitutus sp.]MCS6275109.1 hypothetical protein [Opitutus sp.]MCS6276763.1 hypothetical protein [Opitutus sp.]MCS6301588.1 hypothetical protein [Opitutus sp.]